MSDRRQREQQEEVVSAKGWATNHESGARGSIKIPDGAKMFKIKKAGSYRVDFLPYRVGKRNRNAAPGKLYWERTYFCHRIGDESYVCPKKEADQPCPVCEYVSKKFSEDLSEAEEKEVKGLRPKERQLFNVIDRDNPEAGVQLWEFSYHTFGKNLKEKLDRMDSDVDYDLFADLKRGYTLVLGAVEKSAGSYKFFDVVVDEFRPRKKPLDPALLEEVHCLDDLIVLKGYEELKRIFQGVPEEDDAPPERNGRASRNDDDNATPRRNGRPAKAEDEDDDEGEPASTRRPGKKAQATAEDAGIEQGDMVMMGEIECEVIKVSPDGTSLTLEDQDGEVYRAVSPAEVKKLPTPAAAPARGKAKGNDDDTPRRNGRPAKAEDEDDDDEPAPRRGKTAATAADDDDDDVPGPRRSRR